MDFFFLIPGKKDPEKLEKRVQGMAGQGPRDRGLPLALWASGLTLKAQFGVLAEELLGQRPRTSRRHFKEGLGTAS